LHNAAEDRLVVAFTEGAEEAFTGVAVEAFMGAAVGVPT